MSAPIGFVYLLTNPYMEVDGYPVYKIGCTQRSPHARAEELSNSTGVPAPFRVRCFIEVPDFERVEKDFHRWLAGNRVSEFREFFLGNVDFAIRCMYWHPKRISFCIPGDGGFDLFEFDELRRSDNGRSDDSELIPIDLSCNPFAQEQEKKTAPLQLVHREL